MASTASMPPPSGVATPAPPSSSFEPLSEISSLRAWLENLRRPDNLYPHGTLESSSTSGDFSKSHLHVPTPGTSTPAVGHRSLSGAPSEIATPAHSSDCSSEVPSLSCGSSINSRAFSVNTSLASAVSGYPLGDPEEGNIVARPRASLQCSFWFLDCDFTSDSFSEWKEHCIGHFHGLPPPRIVTCPLCQFKGKFKYGIDAWNVRLDHVAVHHSLGYSLAAGRPDFQLFEYLWKKDLIDYAQYKDLMRQTSSERTNQDPAIMTYENDSRRR